MQFTSIIAAAALASMAFASDLPETSSMIINYVPENPTIEIGTPKDLVHQQIDFYYGLDCDTTDPTAYFGFLDGEIEFRQSGIILNPARRDQISLMMPAGTLIKLYEENDYRHLQVSYFNEGEEDRCVNFNGEDVEGGWVWRSAIARFNN